MQTTASNCLHLQQTSGIDSQVPGEGCNERRLYIGKRKSKKDHEVRSEDGWDQYNSKLEISLREQHCEALGPSQRTVGQIDAQTL